MLAFPCNQFGSQEPGSNAEIYANMKKDYNITFPMFAKSNVNGACPVCLCVCMCMYVCMYVYTYVCNVCLCVNLCTYIRVYLYVFMHVYIFKLLYEVRSSLT